MTELPEGWSRAPLGHLVDILDSQRVPVSAKERASRSGPVPYYGATGQVGRIDRPLFDEELVLVGEDGVQFFDPGKPKAYRIVGPAWVNNHAHVLRARDIDARYLTHYLNQVDYRGLANGTTRLKLTQAAMCRVPVMSPPIDEQRRIVEILVDHLSRLDAADAYLTTSARRLATMSIAGLWQATHGLDGAVGHRLHDVADVRLGRQRSPKNHQGDRMVPYMRAANVDWNRLRLDDVKAMQFTAAESAIYELRPGDILLTEASGSASEVGKSVLYRGEVPGACFQNTLLRVRCRQGNPEFVQRYLLAEARAGRFRPQSRGVGIHHLGRQRLADFPIELPPLDRQVTAVAEADDVLDGCERLRAGLEHARRMQQQLRRALLHAAFTGRLTGHASDTNRVEELAARPSASGHLE